MQTKLKNFHSRHQKLFVLPHLKTTSLANFCCSIECWMLIVD